MNLSQYLELPEMTQQRLAEAIRLDDGRGLTQGAISQWLRKGVPAERVLQLVRVSGGVMTSFELRPDLYPEYPDRDRPTADAREPTDAGNPIPDSTAGGDQSTDEREVA